ncbi:L-rhamnose mutarotase [Paenibacillus mendelii]|uniref:L-rhamnose mutarotase n=1 Tax=Paenibacillus mendelii TaxID=206163 RepID=A0ABV6JAT8_9BACL|nr:L-rhamnose mutarotase [Paenibacillus mendelii]MCQ6560693.1 L-rhamnose mutarotase [Paenibacillus mendelii]
MARHFFKMACKPGCEQEYVKRHEAVFPDLLASLKRVGVSHYSIFMKGTELYAYMVVDDYDKAMAELGNDPANQRWQVSMYDLMETDENGVIVEVIDNEVFYLA